MLRILINRADERSQSRGSRGAIANGGANHPFVSGGAMGDAPINVSTRNSDWKIGQQICADPFANTRNGGVATARRVANTGARIN